MTLEDYYWNYSIPMLKLMTIDYSHSITLSEKQRKKMETKRKIEELLNNNNA